MFKEAYFSMIDKGKIKKWKNISNDLNIIVPIGEIQFVIYDEISSIFSIKLSQKTIKD